MRNFLEDYWPVLLGTFVAMVIPLSFIFPNVKTSIPNKWIIVSEGQISTTSKMKVENGWLYRDSKCGGLCFVPDIAAERS